MVFLWFSYGFPMVRASQFCPKKSLGIRPEHHRRWWPHCNWSDPPSARPSLPTDRSRPNNGATATASWKALWLIMWVNPIGSTIPNDLPLLWVVETIHMPGAFMALLYSHDFKVWWQKHPTCPRWWVGCENLRCQKIWTSFVNSTLW